MAYGSPGRSSCCSTVVTLAPTISSRAEEISRSRIELLGLLHDVPEAQFELSLTDLVEKTTDPTNAGSEPKEEKQALCTSQQRLEKVVVVAKEKVKVVNRTLARKSRSTGSDGVLLNVFLPKPIGRSSTYPRKLGSEERHGRAVVGRSTNIKENHSCHGMLDGLVEHRRAEDQEEKLKQHL